jgi:hypothetical protein
MSKIRLAPSCKSQSSNRSCLVSAFFRGSVIPGRVATNTIAPLKTKQIAVTGAIFGQADEMRSSIDMSKVHPNNTTTPHRATLPAAILEICAGQREAMEMLTE